MMQDAIHSLSNIPYVVATTLVRWKLTNGTLRLTEYDDELTRLTCRMRGIYPASVRQTVDEAGNETCTNNNDIVKSEGLTRLAAGIDNSAKSVHVFKSL